MTMQDRKRVLVMVIDDQLQAVNPKDARIETYKSWLSKIEAALVGKWTFDVHFCSALADVARIEIEADAAKLAIVDMVLDGQAWPISSVEHLDRKLIDEAWPLILVSARFDSTQAISRANRLVGKPVAVAPFQFLLWSSISRSTDNIEVGEVALS